MEHRRYGEFRFNDYCASWIGIAALLIFAVVSLALKLHFLLAVFPSLYAIIWIWTILAPNIEKFSISSEKIIVKMTEVSEKQEERRNTDSFETLFGSIKCGYLSTACYSHTNWK